MKLGHIAVTLCDTLGYHGAHCVELTLGGQLDAPLVQIALLVDAALAEHHVKAPLIVFDGFASSDYDPQEALELAQVLRSKGYTLLGKTHGALYPRWLPLMNYSVAIVDNLPWATYGVNEVIYQPREGDLLVEPFVGAGNAQAVKAISLPTQRDPAELAAFRAGATYPWNILISPKFTYVEVLV